MAPIATDLSTWQFVQLGWVKFRASAANTLHCRLGGSPTQHRRAAPTSSATQENFQVIQTVLGNSAPQPPTPGNLYAPGCYVGSQGGTKK